MAVDLTTGQVWQEIDKQLFAVLGFVTPKQEARTVGIVYVTSDRKLYIGSEREAWKVKHIAQNPHVSLTVTIPKSVPFMPFIKIPAATITFAGTAQILGVDAVSAAVIEKLYRGMKIDEAFKEQSAVIEVTPVREFMTYGVG
ncbi:MAG: pyridoxamine 5'-phosphate oxidase family protein, partial [Anaerolineales bacterium]|nr:pyridoxamine 5'-phosphate oxidase family protein [Anaerolineales bacterium]